VLADLLKKELPVARQVLLLLVLTPVAAGARLCLTVGRRGDAQCCLTF